MRSIVLIGASTGAPRIHHEYLLAMPPRFNAPVIIIQHMPKGPFIEGLIRYLRDTVSSPCKLAEDGDPLHPGTVLVAEPGTQVRVSRSGTAIRVAPEAGENFFSPSMDVTFSSAAAAFGAGTFVAMTSGLHADHDGLVGCEAVRSAGGRVLITTPETTPCYQMIKHVRRAGIYDAEVPLTRILPRIAEWMRS